LAPLIVVAVIAEGRFSVAEAGWVLSARALGELLASLAVPALGLLHLGRSAAFAASACLLSALVVSMSAHLAAVVLGFFVVGACSGVLKFLGTMAASAYRHRTFAFILRLALTLALAGIATCILLAMEASSSWATLLERLIVLLLPIMVLGGCFYRPLKEQHSSSARQPQAKSAHAISGLVILYLFFVGISGFLAYVAQQAATRGMSISDALLSIGAMKTAAAVWLLVAACLVPNKEGKEVSALEAALLVAAVWAVYCSRNVVEFLAAFLLLEITLNGFSARLQSAIVGAAPHFAGQWLNGVILLGAATGPPLYGLAISAQFELGFVALGSVAICLPLAWRILAGCQEAVSSIAPARS
jgi:hypothetical protein